MHQLEFMIKGITATTAIFLCMLIGVFADVFGQQVLSEQKLRRFPKNQALIYPYEELGRGLSDIYVGRDPIVKLSNDTFVLLWKKDWGPSTRRVLSCYDVLLDTVWERNLDLNRNEEIIYMYEEAEELLILTYRFDFAASSHTIFCRKVDYEKGEIGKPNIWWLAKGKFSRPVGWERSPNGQKLLFYQLLPLKENGRINDLYVYPSADQRYSSINSKVARVFFSVLSRQGETLRTDTLAAGRKKWYYIGAGVDNQGHMYASFFEKKNSLHVFQSHAVTGESSQLTYDGYTTWPDVLDIYYNQLPLKVGSDQRVYAPQAQRKVTGRGKGLKKILIPCFDFAKQEVDTIRTAPITSSLQVLSGKERQEFGLKPSKRMDEFVFRHIHETDSGSLWVWMQKQLEISRPADAANPTAQNIYEGRWEEWMLFEFNTKGEIEKALIVPTIQEIYTRLDQMSSQPQVRMDSRGEGFHLLTRESSGDKIKGPERMYHRYVELKTGRTSPRRLVYERRRRNQYVLDAFIEWLNDDLICFVALDGEQGSAYLVTVNLAMEPEEDE
ncbi:MAG: hypothetical protein AAFR59_01025 [Bacteroidota bacterium]